MAAESGGGDEAVVDLAQLQAVGDVTFKAQLAAGGGNIQQLAVDRRFELFAAQFDVDQIGQFQCGAKGIAPLVIHHFVRQVRRYKSDRLRSLRCVSVPLHSQAMRTPS